MQNIILCHSVKLVFFFLTLISSLFDSTLDIMHLFYFTNVKVKLNIPIPEKQMKKLIDLENGERKSLVLSACHKCLDFHLV